MGEPRRVPGPQRVVAFALGREGPKDEFAAASILEQLALLGRGIPDSAESRSALARKMDSFSRCTALLDSRVMAHAARFCDGFYKEEGKDRSEQTRMNVLIITAIHVTDCILAMHPKVQEMNDSGVSTLFEKALDSASALIDRSFFQNSADDGLVRFRKAYPLIIAALKSCGMAGRAVPLSGVYAANKEEALERITLAVKRLHGPEEAA